MRIISGIHGGIHLQAPKNLPVRPTTDLAKSALFNILQQRYDLSSVRVLDLFSGTGNLSYEFASRACTEIIAVDKHPACVRFIKETASRLNMNIEVQKADVFKWLRNANDAFDLIVADPPYDLPNIYEIVDLVFQQSLLKSGGLLVIEHATQHKLPASEYHVEDRVYGSSTFSFYSHSK